MTVKFTIATTVILLLGACATPQALPDMLDASESDEPNVVVQVREDPSQRHANSTYATDVPDPGSGALMVEIGDEGKAIARDLFGPDD